ncbi:MAG TPA: heme-binding protein [Opitutus sp.]|nr:heme-binding protein [Opitutus sp.]
MAPLTLSLADQIINAAIAQGRSLRLSALAIAVLDAGGHLIAFKREDGAGFFRFDIAYGKAWGALGLGFGSRELADRAAKLPSLYASFTAASQGRVIPSPGGVLIADRDGNVIGAVGVSGDLGDNDEACALAGIAAAGLTAFPGAKG